MTKDRPRSKYKQLTKDQQMTKDKQMTKDTNIKRQKINKRATDDKRQTISKRQTDIDIVRIVRKLDPDRNVAPFSTFCYFSFQILARAIYGISEPR